MEPESQKTTSKPSSATDHDQAADDFVNAAAASLGATGSPPVARDPDQKEKEEVEKASARVKDAVKALSDILRDLPERLKPTTYSSIAQEMEDVQNEASKAATKLAGKSVRSLKPAIDELSTALTEIMHDKAVLPAPFLASLQSVVTSLEPLRQQWNTLPPYPVTGALAHVRQAIANLSAINVEQFPTMIASMATTLTSNLALLQNELDQLPQDMEQPAKKINQQYGSSANAPGDGAMARAGADRAGAFGAAGGAGGAGGGEEENFFSKLKGVPVDYLISTPLIASARSNMALAQVMVEFINLIGFDKDGKTRLVEFELTRPFIPESGVPSEQKLTVKAPLLGLVPIPALLIQSVDIDLTVEIGDTNVQKIDTTKSAKLDVSGGWGFVRATFTGSLSNTESNTRTTNQTAKYHVSVNAQQQPLPEGMSKLMDVMATCIVPIPANK